MMMKTTIPAPKNLYKKQSSDGVNNSNTSQSSSVKLEAPLYPHRCNSNFRPRKLADYNDGGAYPEIHCTQYPLEMGRPGARSSGTLAVDVDQSTGMVKYDAIVSKGRQLVKTSLKDTHEARADGDEIALPDQSEEAATAERTMKALELVLAGKDKKDGGMGSLRHSKEGEEVANYVRYTPNPEAPGYSAQQRVIKVVEAKQDPMEPPKHKIKKAPFKHDADAVVPVLHKEDKVTIAERQAWKIPPVVSNWKNDSGFVIALDKRLAADGRGTAQVTINDKFAQLSEALYMSERKAAEDLSLRSNIRKQIAMQEKEEKEASLRDLAAKARLERAGLPTSDAAGNTNTYGEDTMRDGDGSAAFTQRRGRQSNVPAWMANADAANTAASAEKEAFGEPDSPHSDGTASVDVGDRQEASEDEEDEADIEERKKREKQRQEKRQERLREMRGGRASKETRDAGRDISEKIALGMHTGKGGGETEAAYDSRLFNQSAGIGNGFCADDSYEAYTKSMFADRQAGASAIYRPKAEEGSAYGTVDEQLDKLKNTDRFRADKGFAGTEGGHAAGGAAGPRSEPVQFEKSVATTQHTQHTMETSSSNNNTREREDVFDIGDLVESKRARRE